MKKRNSAVEISLTTLLTANVSRKDTGDCTTPEIIVDVGGDI